MFYILFICSALLYPLYISFTTEYIYFLLYIKLTAPKKLLILRLVFDHEDYNIHEQWCLSTHWFTLVAMFYFTLHAQSMLHHFIFHGLILVYCFNINFVKTQNKYITQCIFNYSNLKYFKIQILGFILMMTTLLQKKHVASLVVFLLICPSAYLAYLTYHY